MGKELVLVNEKNEITGYGEKLKVHEAGLLHRAFSVLILNDKNEMLLQKRAISKYHSGGLWSNACCSHPLKGEDFPQLIHHRLAEEMGFDCNLKELFSFIYRATFANGLTEHEYDTVFSGNYNGKVTLNPEEASDYQWMDMDQLKSELLLRPEKYSVWLKEIVKRFDKLSV